MSWHSALRRLPPHPARDRARAHAPRRLAPGWRVAALAGVAALVPCSLLRGQPPTYVGGVPAAAPALTVLRTTPADSAAPRAIVTVTFDRPVADALAGRAPAPALLTLAPAVPGRLRWRDPVTLAFVPDSAFQPGRRYTATVAAGIVAVDGTRLARPHQFAFRVPAGRLLAVHASGPYPGTRLLPPSPLVQLVYAGALPPDSLPRLARLARLELAPSCPGGAASVALRATGHRPLRDEDPWELQVARQHAAPWGAASLHVAELAPARPLPLDCRFAVVAPATLDDSVREERTEFRTHPTFRLLGARCLDGEPCWRGPVILDFSTPVRGGDLQRHLRSASGLALTVGGDTSRVQTAWAVGGAFAPRSAYTFVVDGALRDLFGQPLGEERTATLRTSGIPATIAVGQGARYVSRADSAIHVRHVNVDTILVTALPVPPALERQAWALGAASEGRALDEVWRALSAAGAPITLRVPLAGALDEERVTAVPLPDSLWGAGGRMTLVYVRLHTPRSEPDAERRFSPNAHDPPSGLDFWRMLLLQRTDLAVHARVGRAGGAVWLTDARTLRPRAGALVQLLDTAGRVRAEGRTDAGGVAELALDAAAEAAAAQRRLPPPGDDPLLQYLDHDPAAAEPLGVLRVTAGDDQALAAPGPPLGGWFGRDDGEGVGTELTLARAGMLATDRGLYRPGERVFATAVVRRGPLHALAPPAAGDSVRWVTRHLMNGDWRRALVRDTVTTLSPFGTAVDSTPLPRTAELGDYQLTLYAVSGGRWRPVRRTTYRVAEYRPPEFLAEASADSTAPHFAGDTLGVLVQARYLYGAPMPGAVVRWTATATPLAGWAVALPLPPGFVVGSEGWRYWLDAGAGQPERLGGGEDTLGADGARRLAVPTALPPTAPGIALHDESRAAGGPMRVRVEAAVTDLNRQAVATEAAVTLHPASYYVAARVAPWAADSTAALRGGVTGGVVDSVERVEVLVVTPEGERRADVPVTVTVRRFTGRSAMPYGPPATDTVARCAVVSGADAATCRWTPTRAGEHEIELTARDPQGRRTRTTLSRWIVDPAAAPDWTRRPIASFALDRLEYAPGDTAHLTLLSPFRDAEAWLTVEREGLLEQRRLRVRDHAASVALPIHERLVPGAMVHAVLVAHEGAVPRDSVVAPACLGCGLREDQGPVRTAALALRVSAEGRRLRVALAPARAELTPGDSARLRVQVRDSAGAGVRAEVTLWAVDEGVLALTGHEPPDPIAALYRPRGSALGLASSERARLQGEPPPLATEGGRLVLREAVRLEEVVVTGIAEEQGVPAPVAAPPPPPPPPLMAPQADFAGRGGGAGQPPAVPPVRVDFRSTAFYAGRARTGADGVATVAARLPDNLTTYRLVALAVAADSRAGADTGALVATRALVARPALPRFVRPGDHVDAGVVVAVREARPAADTVRVSAAAARALVLDDTAARTVAVADARSAEARFPFHVPTAAAVGDSAVARFVATGASGADAVAVRLPVAPAVHPRVHVVAGLVRGEAAVVFTLPPGTDAARSRLTLDAGPSALAAVRGAARQLRPAPHDFAERLASAALAWAALAQADTGAPAREARAEAARAVELLVARQRPDGGFGLFVHDPWASVWLSAYVGIALLEARAADVAVDAAAVDRLRAFLQGSLRVPPPRDPEPGWPMADSVARTRGWLAHRVAAADFLRRAGTPAPAVEDSLLGWAPVMAWEDRLRLAELLAARDERREPARRLLDDAWRSARAGGRRVLVADSVLADTPWSFPSHLRPVARLLTATLALEPEAPLLGALVETVLRQEQAERGRVWNTQDLGAVLPALARFDRRAAANGAPLRLMAGARTVLTLRPGADSADRELSLAGLLGGDGAVRLRLVTAGDAPAYFWATVHEVPATPPVSPDTSGFVVERWTERLDGTPVARAQPGELVRVRLRVTVPEDRHFVVLEDPLPAGLEVVDLRLGTSGTLDPFLAAAEGMDAAGDAERAASQGWRSATHALLFGRWEDGQWSPWAHRELRDDRVVWATRLLWRGRYDVSYVARATTSGSFVRPPARAEELYDAGLHGRSEGARWTVLP